MATTDDRRKALDDILAQRVLVLDGAMGTMLQQQRLTAGDSAARLWKGATKTWCAPGRM